MLHYQASEKYEPHWDYFHDTVNIQNGGQRVATMLMYLTDVEAGGETVFPNSHEKPVSGPSHAFLVLYIGNPGVHHIAKSQVFVESSDAWASCDFCTFFLWCRIK